MVAHAHGDELRVGELRLVAEDALLELVDPLPERRHLRLELRDEWRRRAGRPQPQHLLLAYLQILRPPACTWGDEGK